MPIQASSELLEGVIIALLDEKDLYGYVLTREVQEIIDVSESSVYPVLRRLTKEEYLLTYDEPYQGRNRRYYQVTEAGKFRLEIIKREWEQYKKKIDGVFENGYD